LLRSRSTRHVAASRGTRDDGARTGCTTGRAARAAERSHRTHRSAARRARASRRTCRSSCPSPGRNATFTTEDGQIWVQTDGQSTNFPDVPFAAEIKPGAMGSSFLVPKDRARAVRVRRGGD
jgi:hypothetical protein